MPYSILVRSQANECTIFFKNYNVYDDKWGPPLNRFYYPKVCNVLAIQHSLCALCADLGFFMVKNGK